MGWGERGGGAKGATPSAKIQVSRSTKVCVHLRTKLSSLPQFSGVACLALISQVSYFSILTFCSLMKYMR